MTAALATGNDPAQMHGMANMRWHEHEFSSVGCLEADLAPMRPEPPGHPSPALLPTPPPPPGGAAHSRACWHIHSIGGTFVSIQNMQKVAQACKSYDFV
ncbi:hypothetical protein [Aminobacter aminovorans]|uniref:hypothetical protein n=1 Tax=Aminobacter TaxID=31988 RepID=UPI002866C203|nr:hypothetical protein [Aminobacter aminovorans]MDR7221758.1 hypothetical protein [Aminobacter aminovorans]